MSASVIAALLALSSWLVMQAPPVPLLIFAVACCIVGAALPRSYPYGTFGACNHVTLARAGLVAFLAGTLLAEVSAWLILAVASVAFALDGVDGWLARRQGLTSRFGARFDMEVDAALAATLALLVLQGGQVGAEIVVLGFTRYAFVLAAIALPWLRRDLPGSFRRKAICVVQIAALLALLVPVMPDALAPAISVGAAAALIYSFAIDVLWLARRR
ncbi:MAG: CDP-alcohol phosphatidyltransferase family protein [Pseudomonadota bacterium]